MIKRAAVGFDNLTPRPDIRQICEEQQVDYNQVFKEEKRRKKNGVPVVRYDRPKKTTEDYFVDLI